MYFKPIKNWRKARKDAEALKPHKSFAQWPKGTLHDGIDISDDSHPNKEAAQAVCNRLHLEGLGGDRKIFPIKTWVELIK